MREEPGELPLDLTSSRPWSYPTPVPLITKVELKNGTVYELGRAWPVRDQKEGSTKGALLVGLIRLCPAEGESDDEGSVSMPPYYEIWCAPPSLLENFFTPAQRALFKNDPTELEVWKQELFAQDFVKHKITYSREVYLSQVAHVEKSWPTPDALREVIETVINPTFAPENEGPPDAMVEVPPNGEQKSTEPVA